MNDRYISHGPLFQGCTHNHLHKINPPLHKVHPFHPDITETGGQKAPTNERPRTRASFGDVYVPSSR